MKFIYTFLLLVIAIDGISQGNNFFIKGTSTSNISGSYKTKIVFSNNNVSRLTILCQKPSASDGRNSQYFASSTTALGLSSQCSDYFDSENNIFDQFYEEIPSSLQITTQTSFNGSNIVDIKSNGDLLNADYPINSNDIFGLNEYLSSTFNIQKDDANIVNIANRFRNLPLLSLVIESVSEYIRGNVVWTDYVPNDAASVAATSKGNCQGFSNLMVAVLRNLGIPAKVDAGFVFDTSILITLNTPALTGSFTLGNSATGFHAAYEVYYPNKGWIQGDAQATVNFTSNSFIKTGSFTDLDFVPLFASYWYDSNKPLPTVDYTFYPLVISSSQTPNYEVCSSYNPFPTTVSNRKSALVSTDYREIATGINDVVQIKNPPSGTHYYLDPWIIPNNTNLMTPCTNASFYAQFQTDYQPRTSACTFDWKIVLYHSGGEYVYAQQNGLFENTDTPNSTGEGCVWQPTLSALPAYNWSIDYNGNVYGKVSVIVHKCNGGGDISNDSEIGVHLNTEIKDITYAVNTTITATCTKLNLTNVGITSPASVTFNSNGLGIGIIGTFVAQKGSTLTINK